MAELLAGEGFEVELVTLCEQIAPVCDETLEGPLLRERLHAAGVCMHRSATVERIEPAGIAGSDEFGDPFALEVDGVVLVTQRLSNESVYAELAADRDALAAEGVEGLFRIGDCVSPRMIADAIFDGHRLGREIDSDNPSVPLPFLRERLVLNRVS